MPPDIRVVAFDLTAAGVALAECIQRRAAGERFYALPLPDDQHVIEYTRVAAQLIEELTDPDQRYLYARELGIGALVVNGAPVNEMIRIDEQQWSVAVQAIMLSDELLVRSYGEYISHYARRVEGHKMRRILLAPSITDVNERCSAEMSVVIWTGRRPSSSAAIALLGSEELRMHVSYVGDVPLRNVRATYVDRHDPALGAILGAASCIVCVDPSDPSDAVAFARRGIPVVAPITSGALEFDPEIVTWDASLAHNLYRAVALALGRAPGTAVTEAVPATPPTTAYPLPIAELPLVSILTPTYNRPERLRMMLESIAAQTYPNVESVIVNDCGAPVDEIVRAFPFARLFTLERNGGAEPAMARALAESRGTYIGLLPDDDWLYPDHVERLMKAILRSGAGVAHGNAMLHFFGTDETGAEVTTGFNPIVYAQTINPTAALMGTPVAHHQVIQRKDIYGRDDVGWLRSDTLATDQEYHMRLVERHQLAWVDAFTCEFRDHGGNMGKDQDWAAISQQMFDELQPRLDRPIITQFRENALKRMREAPIGGSVNRPTLVIVPGR